MLTNEELLALWSGGSVGVTRPVLGSLKVIAFARAVERAAYERAAQWIDQHAPDGQWQASAAVLVAHGSRQTRYAGCSCCYAGCSAPRQPACA